jgi:hypothetical protein
MPEGSWYSTAIRSVLHSSQQCLANRMSLPVTLELLEASMTSTLNRYGSNRASYRMRFRLAALRSSYVARLALHRKPTHGSRSQSSYVKCSKVNCLVAQVDHRHAHKHVQQLSNVSLPAATHETLSKGVRIKGPKQTTIEPLPIGRRSKPGVHSHLEDLIAGTTKAPSSRRRQQHRLTHSPTCSPHSPSRCATDYIHQIRPLEHTR